MPERIDSDLPAWLRTEAKSLLGLLLLWTGDRHRADDLFQETCFEAWRNRHRFETGQDLGAWVRGIAKNVVLRQVRERRRDRSVPLTEKSLEVLEAAWLERQAEDEGEVQKREALRDCLSAVSADGREWLRQHYEEQWPIARIAAASGRSPDAMKMVLSRIRARLHACVSRRLARGHVHD